MFVEECIRFDGDFGVKYVCYNNEGIWNYFVEIYGNFKRFLFIYEYVNNICIVGLGEFIVVLNGVEFRIRYNDY